MSHLHHRLTKKLQLNWLGLGTEAKEKLKHTLVDVVSENKDEKENERNYVGRQNGTIAGAQS